MGGASAEETRITVRCMVPCTSITRSQLDNLCLSATSLQLHKCVRLCQYLTQSYAGHTSRCSLELHSARQNRSVLHHSSRANQSVCFVHTPGGRGRVLRGTTESFQRCISTCSVSFHCQKLLKFALSCSLRLLTRARLWLRCSRRLLRRSRRRRRSRSRCCLAVAATHCAFNSRTTLCPLSVSFRS